VCWGERMTELAPRPSTRILRPRKRWLPPHPRELWEFRSLLVRFAARDVTLRYRQTALGAIWVILQPLLGAGILSFVFGSVAGLPSPAGIPYFVFSLVGMVGWTAFSQVTTRASSSLVSNAQLIQKIYFPRLLLPLSTVLSTLIDVGVSLGLVAVVMAIAGVAPGASVATFPLWLALFVAVGLGIGLASSALMVRYRDVQYVLPLFVQLLLFLSPVAYDLSAVPKGSLRLYELNPLAGLLEGLRWSVLGTPAPSIGLVAYSVSASLMLFLVGLAVFHRMERGFADVI
jgi:lipopolysaccharide transport system permease protein